MLEKPEIADETIRSGLRDAYGLHISGVTFLPLGADVNTAVYRVEDADGTPYFLKLRSGDFDEAVIAIPRFLRDAGIAQIIAPIATTAGALWTRIGGYAATLAPFVTGRDGFEVALTDDQWTQLGVALRGIHTAALPRVLTGTVPHEAYSPRWRENLRAFLAQAETATHAEPVAATLVAFLHQRREEITHLIGRSERLADRLRARPRAHVLCHADIHAWNVLIGNDGALYVVDWDTLIFAPKERDLMYIGGGVGGSDWSGERETALFYRGYGQTEIDATALAYYRHERIVEDTAVTCDELLTMKVAGDDRARMLWNLTGQFDPGGVVEIARRSDVSP